MGTTALETLIQNFDFPAPSIALTLSTSQIKVKFRFRRRHHNRDNGRDAMIDYKSHLALYFQFHPMQLHNAQPFAQAVRLTARKWLFFLQKANETKIIISIMHKVIITAAQLIRTIFSYEQ